MVLTEVLNGRKQLFPARVTVTCCELVPVHPLAAVYEYVIVYGPPTPAVAGVKVVPLIPGPLNVPPTGEPVSVAAAAVDWYVAESPEKDTLGTVFIVAITGMRLL